MQILVTCIYIYILLYIIYISNHTKLSSNKIYFVELLYGGFLRHGGTPKIIPVMDDYFSIETHGDLGIPNFKKPKWEGLRNGLNQCTPNIWQLQRGKWSLTNGFRDI